MSPLFGLLILACLGETSEKHKERIMQEEEWRLSVRNSKSEAYKEEKAETDISQNSSMHHSETNQTINDLYKK